MLNPKYADPETQQAIAEGQALLRTGALPALFAVLASSKAGQPERRAAAAYISEQFVPLGVALEARAFTANECAQLERGLWHAAVAAPRYSKVEGLNGVLWERAFSGLYQHDPKAAATALRYAAMDQKLKPHSPTVKHVAANLNFMGMMWRAENWGTTPQTATTSFNRTVKRIGQKLHPASRYVGDLKQRQAELASRRKHMAGAAVA